jgi:hypothetical protein
MNIQYCCAIRLTTPEICHHNIKVDGQKYRLIDIGCKYSRQDIKEMAKNPEIFFKKNGVHQCSSEDCEVL